MATTTNYGWTTPDDTALVKDGASAIRTLGSSVDTTTKNLNPSTTLGDIEYRSSTSNTNTRLGIGTTGQVLTVAAGVPSWATPSGGSFVGCLATISGSQTIANATQTKKTFTGTDIFDTDGFHDPASNDSRITIPAGLGGYYLVYTKCTWDGNSVGRRAVYITKNNGVALTASEGFVSGASVYPTTQTQIVLNLSASDYVETEVFQSSGGNLNTDNGPIASQFGVIKLS